MDSLDGLCGTAANISVHGQILYGGIDQSTTCHSCQLGIVDVQAPGMPRDRPEDDGYDYSSTQGNLSTAKETLCRDTEQLN